MCVEVLKTAALGPMALDYRLRRKEC